MSKALAFTAVVAGLPLFLCAAFLAAPAIPADVGVTGCTPGDGTTTTMCPCNSTFGQIADPGHGCGNSAFTGGAILTASGTDLTAGADDVTMTLSTFTPGSPALLLEGSILQPAGVALHDGVWCIVNPGILRVWILPKMDNGCGVGCQPNGGDDLAIDGMVTWGPSAGDASITSQTAAASATTYGYAAWYRNANPSWCPTATSNISQQINITWL